MSRASLSSIFAIVLLASLTIGCSSGPATAGSALRDGDRVAEDRRRRRDVARHGAERGRRPGRGDRPDSGRRGSPRLRASTQGDVVKVARSDVLIVNGAGFEGFLDELLSDTPAASAW